MASIFGLSLALASVALCLSACHAQKIGIEVWMNGSDIETPKHTATKALRDSIEGAVSHSQDMQLSAANAGAVRITIPQDVIIAREADVDFVLFTANISVNKPAYTLDVSGYCRYNDLASCTDKIIVALRAASLVNHKNG